MVLSKDNLKGKTVMTNEGHLFGKICESFIDDKTGITKKIKVEPTDTPLQEIEDNKEFIFNSSSFIQVKDIVVIEQD